MSMQITNNYNNYNAGYAAAAGKPQAAQGQTADKTDKSSGAAKTSKDKVADYYSSLQKKYECVKNGSVAISGKYLKECASDPAKAKELEENLSFFKESCKNGYQNAKTYLQSLGDTLNSYSETWSIDETGNVTMMAQVSGTVNTGTKDSKELQKEQEERLKEKKEKERLEEKRKEKKEQEEKLRGIDREASPANGTRKTAADELSYLSDKYDGITFVAANYKKGMKYGSTDTTNIAISPAFLKKMANDPKLEKEYEEYFSEMQKLDKENILSHEARGRHIVAQGWAIDKDGGISKWGISEPANKRNYGREMTERADKIRREKTEKKKEQQKLAEKRQKAKEVKEVKEAQEPRRDTNEGGAKSVILDLRA